MDRRAVRYRSPSPAEAPGPAAPASATPAIAPPVSAPPAQCRLAATDRDRRAHFAVRHAVFVTEQEFFLGTDRDGHDEEPGVRHVLAWHGGTPAGAVRLYPLEEPGIWRGDRLAVLPAFRSRGLGAPLVRFAVRTAAELGGRRMVAHIQPQNIAFFEYLGWRQIGGQVTYIGHPHLPMAIALPPRAGTRPAAGAGRTGNGRTD
ncbi:MAG: MSMEG_0567/Sll0786 family nitrogen starvation N-acetyltransferase [Streptosporangiaceae bacterium]